MRLSHPAVLFSGLCACACAPTAPDVDPNYRIEIEVWRKHRIERLTAPDGWLSLAGLFWLKPGVNRVGTRPELEVVLPESVGIGQIGVLTLVGDTLSFRAEASGRITSSGRPVTMQNLESDADDAPTVLETGKVLFFVIKRGDHYAVRVKDPDSRVRREFHGLSYFPIDQSWRIAARFEANSPPRRIEVPNVIGTVDQEMSPGEAVFTRGGQEYRLQAITEADTSELFFVFADTTNGRQTHGAGRFLYAPTPRNGQVLLDFNKAFNPACAFTPYATCPLPLKNNRLSLAVTAGEKTYGEHK